MHILTINIIRSKVDLDSKSFIGIFDCWQGEVRQGLLGKIWHHSLWGHKNKKHVVVNTDRPLLHTHSYMRYTSH